MAYCDDPPGYLRIRTGSLRYRGMILRTQLTPVFDKYDIDVVLQGHDHTYSRSKILYGDGKHMVLMSSDWMRQVWIMTGIMHTTKIQGTALL